MFVSWLHLRVLSILYQPLVFQVHLKAAAPPPGPPATFDRCSLPKVCGSQEFSKNLGKEWEYHGNIMGIMGRNAGNSWKFSCACFLCPLISLCVLPCCVDTEPWRRVQHMLDYEAVPTECIKALRALASLAYKDVNEVVLSSTRY